MKTRKATILDVSAIAEVHVASWHGAYKGIVPDEYIRQLSVEKRAASWRKRILDPKKSCIFVTENKDKIVAFACVGPAREEDHEFEGELYAIYADPVFYRRGVGKPLFEKCVEYLKQQGFANFYCWVLEENKLGRSFYERMKGKTIEGKEKTI